jgi:hypothetical protein
VLYRKIPFLFIVLWLGSTPQQTKPTAHITIQVNDVSGAVTPTAHVEILGANFAKNLETDSLNKLSVDLPIGSYDLTTIQLGFKAAKKRIEVQDTKDQFVTFVLELAPGGHVGIVSGGRIAEPTYAILPDELQEESNILPGTGFCSPCAGIQQTKATAHISIEVHDPTGAPIPKAHVEVSVSATDVKKLDADDNGKLSADLPVGVYEVTASFPAFSAAKKRIEVQDARNQIVIFMLNVAVSGPNVEVLDVPRFSGPMPMPSKDSDKPLYNVTIAASQTATLRSKVKLHIITKNISDKIIYRVVRSTGPPEQDFKISVRKGNRIQQTFYGRMILGTDHQEPWTGSVFTGRYPIQPGDVVEQDLSLGEEYGFTQPGTYSIQVLRSDILTEEEITAHLSPQAVKSNTATVTVLAHK